MIDQLNEGKEDFVAEITSVPDGVLTTRPDEATISIFDANSETQQYAQILCCHGFKCHIQ